MKYFTQIDRTVLISALSGALLALAFPRPDLFWLAWIGLIPLLLVVGKRPFASGFSAGIAFFAIVLYWLNIVMTSYGGLLPVFSAIAYLMLVVYLAFYFGIATLTSWGLKKRYRIPLLFSFPFFWVALEYLRGLIFSGFPWALLGYSQQDFSLAIQSADVTGVYGVSFILVAVNCALAWLIAEPRKRNAWGGAVIVAVLLAGHLGYGYWCERTKSDERGESLRIALIQGNIEQGQKWLPENRQQTVDLYRELSRQAAEQPVDLLLWPEAATPFFLQDDGALQQQVKAVPGETQSALLVGSPSYEAHAEGQVKYYNSAFLFSPRGELLGRSDKLHLVPFGEYVPLKWLLGFLDKLVVGAGDFSSGKLQPLLLADHKLGVLICYEAIFSELARTQVRKGSELLINLTNDAWFGRSSAPYQHLAMVRFRSIENRVWTARAANTGISAIIAPSGTVVSATPLFERLQQGGVVGLGAEQTFYTRYGDVFALACLMLFCFACFALTRKKIKD